MLFLSPKQTDGTHTRLVYRGGWLLTHPDEDFGGPGLNRRDLYSSETSVAKPDETVAGIQVSVSQLQSTGRCTANSQPGKLVASFPLPKRSKHMVGYVLKSFDHTLQDHCQVASY